MNKRVAHADSGGNTIGAEMNKLKQAYHEAITQANANEDYELARILRRCITKICTIDEKALEAIVMVQRTQ